MTLENPDEALLLARERTLLASERNRLAAERTLSAWIRTGLGGVGGGLALIRFVAFKAPHKLVIAYFSGISLVIWGICVFIYALYSYFHVIGRLSRLHADTEGRVGLAILAIVLIILSLFVLVLALE